MRSIKPGRGPSMMGGIGSLFCALFGVIWTVAAASMGAPFFFPLFGVGFVILGIVQAVYQFSNAGRKNRFSAFDITDEREEPDPLNQRFGGESEAPGAGGGAGFCPYCGARAEEGYAYCRSCGKKLPE
jgi:hypothetical protein